MKTDPRSPSAHPIPPPGSARRATAPGARFLATGWLCLAALTWLGAGCSFQFSVGSRDRKPAETAPETERYHLVEKGDTLWAIGRRYGVSPEAIRRANGLEGDRIYPGRRLLIPGGDGPAPDPGPRPATPPAPGPVAAETPPGPTETPSIIAERPPVETAPGPGFSWPCAGSPAARPGNGKGLVLVSRERELLRAPGDGEVIHAGPTREFGSTIITRHADNIFSILAGDIEPLTGAGRAVSRGEVVGRVTRGGEGTPQVYFEMRRETDPVDPREVIGTDPVPLR